MADAIEAMAALDEKAVAEGATVGEILEDRKNAFLIIINTWTRAEGLAGEDIQGAALVLGVL